MFSISISYIALVYLCRIKQKIYSLYLVHIGKHGNVWSQIVIILYLKRYFNLIYYVLLKCIYGHEICVGNSLVSMMGLYCIEVLIQCNFEFIL